MVDVVCIFPQFWKCVSLFPVDTLYPINLPFRKGVQYGLILIFLFGLTGNVGHMSMGHISLWKLLDFITPSHRLPHLPDCSRHSGLFWNAQLTQPGRIFQNDYARMKVYGIIELSPSEGQVSAIRGVQRLCCKTCGWKTNSESSAGSDKTRERRRLTGVQ
jgi:hypothetical protein